MRFDYFLPRPDFFSRKNLQKTLDPWRARAAPSAVLRATRASVLWISKRKKTDELTFFYIENYKFRAVLFLIERKKLDFRKKIRETLWETMEVRHSNIASFTSMYKKQKVMTQLTPLYRSCNKLFQKILNPCGRRGNNSVPGLTQWIHNAINNSA